MSKVREEYNELIKQREKIVEEMNLLHENEIVKRYLELQGINENLYNKQLVLDADIKMEEYNSCKHILVYSRIDHDRYEGRTSKHYGCIKCGLEDSVVAFERAYLPPDKQIMYDYLKEKCLYMLKGIETNIVCDLNLAQAIYSKIKQVHPNIDDETSMKYFETALNDIRNIKVSEERKVSRAKRLSLHPNFTRWNGYDVHND